MSDHVVPLNAPERAPWLANLPSFEPPPAVFERIVAAHRRAARRRWAAGFAVAASAVLAVLVVVRPFAGGEADVSIADRERSEARDVERFASGNSSADASVSRNVDVPGAVLASSIARSRVLERDLAASRSERLPAHAALESALARLDAELQRAYDRNAAEAELSALWSARADTLETLVAAYRNPAAVRI